MGNHRLRGSDDSGINIEVLKMAKTACANVYNASKIIKSKLGKTSDENSPDLKVEFCCTAL
jgi:hypothetical protein